MTANSHNDSPSPADSGRFRTIVIEGVTGSGKSYFATNLIPAGSLHVDPEHEHMGPEGEP